MQEVKIWLLTGIVAVLNAFTIFCIKLFVSAVTKRLDKTNDILERIQLTSVGMEKDISQLKGQVSDHETRLRGAELKLIQRLPPETL